jgi:hypothetical protein
MSSDKSRQQSSLLSRTRDTTAQQVSVLPKTFFVVVLIFTITYFIMTTLVLAAEVDKNVVSVGETVVITPTPNATDLSLDYGGATYRYLGQLDGPINYTPMQPGNYTVTETLADGSTLLTEFVALPLTANESPAITPSNTTPPAPLLPLVSIPSLIPAPPPPSSSPPLSAPLGLKRSDGAPVDAELVWSKGGAVLQDSQATLFNPSSLGTGTYDLDVRVAGQSLRSIRFAGLSYTGNLPLGIEELDPGAVQGAIPADAVAAFAIDPSNLNFTDATITFTAVGQALYKCAAYNFTSRTCLGGSTKVMDLVVGQDYTITLSLADPLFSQTGYLINPNFDTTTGSWTTAFTGTAPTFSWVATDGVQSGIAQINLTTRNTNTVANYYQMFNLTIPPGTALVAVNVSARWRIPTYSGAGWINLTIRNAARTVTYCNKSSTFAAITAWATVNTTTGAPNCMLGNFTPNTNYTIMLYCRLVTANVLGANESCRWDNATIIAWYNDVTAPNITNITRTPNPVNYSSIINFTVNVTDNIAVDTVLIEINGTNYTMIPSSGGIYYYSQFNTAKTPGLYFYKIYANDTSNNKVQNTSNSLNFTIQDLVAPSLNLTSPGNNSFTAATIIYCYYNVSDNVATDNCSLTVNNSVVNSSTNNPAGSTLNLSTNLSYDGVYAWNISCNDTSNNRNTSETRILTRDTSAPTVSLTAPMNGAGLDPSMVTFTFTGSDAWLGNCSLWGNWTGTWTINQTMVPNNGSATNFTAVNISAYGPYVWNVNCTDFAGNNAFAPANYTFIIAGDLYLNNNDISFVSPPFVEGKNITIQAVIHNKANKTESNFKVAFYNGDPRTTGTQIGNNVTVPSIASLGTVTVNQTYLVPVGPSNIFVLIDPPWLGGVLIESNKTNNLANNTFLVPIWQVFYGNVTANVTLVTPFNGTEISWPLPNMTGNIYLTCTGTTNGINFQSLQAIGRNTTGGVDANTINDFADIDQLLTTTNYTDSVNATYTIGGSPRATATFTIFGKNITNVPVANSSSDGNFTTGILWDTSDSSNPYFDVADKEDLVFVTKIRQATGSVNGITDYEISIPSALKSYKGGSTTVTFYYDLQ